MLMESLRQHGLLFLNDLLKAQACVLVKFMLMSHNSCVGLLHYLHFCFHDMFNCSGVQHTDVFMMLLVCLESGCGVLRIPALQTIFVELAFSNMGANVFAGLLTSAMRSDRSLREQVPLKSCISTAVFVGPPGANIMPSIGPGVTAVFPIKG